ncbi:MAG TPA: hypothetical protein VF552_10730 [Allosphingosinicella sp.]|jgi:single-stranded DNA-specific DHH superfamily exonuclease
MPEPELAQTLRLMKESEAAQFARINRLEDALRKIIASEASNEAIRQIARDGFKEPGAPPEGNVGRRRIAQ